MRILKVKAPDPGVKHVAEVIVINVLGVFMMTDWITKMANFKMSA